MEGRKKPFVILVDDEADFRETTAKFLLRRGIESLQAEDCIGVLDLLGRYAAAVDVIVMDVAMPGRDGIACMAEIKQCWADKENIIVTGHSVSGIGIAGMKQGAFDFCMKPVDYEELVEKILLAREGTSHKKFPLTY